MKIDKAFYLLIALEKGFLFQRNYINKIDQ